MKGAKVTPSQEQHLVELEAAFEQSKIDDPDCADPASIQLICELVMVEAAVMEARREVYRQTHRAT